MKISVLCVCFMLVWSCEKEKAKDVKIKLSEDICALCSSNPEHTVGDDLITTSQVVTPNEDGINDVFYISVYNPSDEYINLLDKYPNNSIIFYDRDNKQIANFSPTDSWGWDCRVNGKFVESGLYFYKLTINEKEMEGTFIIVRGSNFDNYIDMKFYDTECSKNCLEIYPDPALCKDYGQCVSNN